MSRKKMYTKELSARVALSARVTNPNRFHVILGQEEQWNVVTDGNIRATKAFETRKSAIQFATETAKTNKGEVVVHTMSGEIEDHNSWTASVL